MQILSKPYKVLVIDDDEEDFFLIKDFLNDLGPDDYLAEWAPNYEEGIRICCENKHNIYLIDHFLGARTGLELITAATMQGSKLPKVLLTGVGDRELDIKAIQAGADDYLPKSQLSTEMLERTIRHALERHEQHILYEQQQARFKTLFEQSNDPIYVTDEDWCFKDANNSFLKLFRLQHDSLLRKGMGDIFEKPQEYTAFIDKVKTDGFVQNFTVDLSVEEESIAALISASPIYDFHKKITGYQGIIHDITQLKRAESELIIADQISLTGRMARMIAHEVRNPLTNINLAADQLIDELKVKDADSAFYADMIKRNSERINNLINDLLNSTRLATPTFVEYPVEQVVQEALSLCNDRINLKGITITAIGLDKQTPLLIDPEKLKIALINLITNAIEAMEDIEKPHLTIRCGSAANAYEIKISDNGKGIDEETQKYLFKAFYTSRKGGMGLGMTAVQNVILQHKGNIKVESKIKEGTTFIISLPYANA